MKKNNNFPSLETINLIIYDLENLQQNLDMILPEEENQKLVRELLQESYFQNSKNFKLEFYLIFRQGFNNTLG